MQESIPASGISQVGGFLKEFLEDGAVADSSDSTQVLPSSAADLFNFLKAPRVQNAPGTFEKSIDGGSQYTPSASSSLPTGAAAVAKHLATAFELASSVPGLEATIAAMISNPGQATSLLKSFSCSGEQSGSEGVHEALDGESPAKHSHELPAETDRELAGDSLAATLDEIKAIQLEIQADEAKVSVKAEVHDNETQVQDLVRADADGEEQLQHSEQPPEARLHDGDNKDGAEDGDNAAAKMAPSQQVYNLVSNLGDTLGRLVAKADVVEKACQVSGSPWEFAAVGIRRGNVVLQKIRNFNDEHRTAFLSTNYHMKVQGLSEKDALNEMNGYMKKLKGIVNQIEAILKPITSTFELRDKLRRKAEVEAAGAPPPAKKPRSKKAVGKAEAKA